jgi:hypothetical protein
LGPLAQVDICGIIEHHRKHGLSDDGSLAFHASGV